MGGTKSITNFGDEVSQVAYGKGPGTKLDEIL